MLTSDRQHAGERFYQRRHVQTVQSPRQGTGANDRRWFGLDGSVGFDKTATYTFDPNNRAVAGKVDFIGLAGHEITEVMGRFGIGQAGTGSGQYGALDLFRYTSPGVLDTLPANGAYFSINGGTTTINTFNGTGGGDLSDWNGPTPDSYNAFITAGEGIGRFRGRPYRDGCHWLRPIGAGRFQS